LTFDLPFRSLHLDSGPSLRGGQWQCLRLVEALGREATLLSPAGSPCFLEARRMGLEVRPLGVLALRRLSRWADVVHAHDARAHTLAALFTSAPLVVSRRVMFPLGRGWASRWKYGRVARFIAVSRHVAHVLEQGGVSADRISVVYDGVPLLDRAAPGKEVVTLASADPGKGVALAIEGARLAGVPLRRIESPPEGLANAGVFVYITHAEGLGSALLAAMSAGVPVVASNVGGIPEFVRHGDTGLLVENTPERIAAAIRRVLDAPDFAALLAARARRMIENEFTVPRMLEGTLNAYRRVLA